jgi:Flp pilus assembly pilin Flp
LGGRGRDVGAAAAEFALLTTLLAGATLGLGAVVGSQVEQPLDAISSVLSELSGVDG